MGEILHRISYSNHNGDKKRGNIALNRITKKARFCGGLLNII